MEGPVMDTWEPAQRVQKDDAGNYRAFIGNEWTPVARAQKDDAGNFRVIRMTPAAPIINTDTPAGLPTDAKLTDIPDWARQYPGLYGVAGATREVLAPLAEAAGLVGGGLVGLPGGPLGSAAGAGIGYAGAKGLTHIADVALGNKPSATPAQALTQGTTDVLTGGLMELGGQAAGQFVAPVIGKGVNLIGRSIGKAADMVTGALPTVNAAKIAREALGPDLDAVRNLLRTAPRDVTAGQAAVDINSPTWQALVDRALQRDPRFLNALRTSQGEVSLNALNSIVGGTTQTAARQVQGAAKEALNEKLIPVLETEIKAANTAGERLPVLQSEAERLSAVAAGKVEDVRRFTAATTRAENAARLDLVKRDLPVGAARYTYLGELGLAAEKEATNAASGSLALGEGARFAQAATDSLAAHGLKPLKSDAIISAIDTKLADPRFAGNRDLDLSGALARVAEDIKTWTNGNGIIDGWALDAIRKNSVTAAIQAMYPAASSKAHKELAAGVMSKVEPMIVNAIEAAGGTGYGKYLKDYATGRQLIEQQRLGARSVELLKANPKRFISLVEGNSPKEVEKIFGPGNYDLATQMSADAMAKLQGAATAVARDKAVATQVTAGQEALRNLLKKDLSVWRLPSYLSVITSSTNKALGILENKIGAKTMDAITKGAKSGKSMVELLDTLPFDQRSRVLKLLSNPQDWGVPISKIGGATINALAGDNINQMSQ